MSIGATRKIGSASSAPSRAERRFYGADNHSQFIENIDTTNNVLVKDDPEHSRDQQSSYQSNQEKELSPPISNAEPNISASLESMAINGMLDAENISPQSHHQKIGVYSNNQTIIKDEEIERTGRQYLKHFYEKNEYPADIDELV